MSKRGEGMPFLLYLVLSPFLWISMAFAMIGAGVAALLLGGGRAERLAEKSPDAYVSVVFGIIAVVVAGLIAAAAL